MKNPGGGGRDLDLGLPRGPIGKDVFFSPGSSSHLGAAHSLFGGALFVLFVQEGAVLCWRSLFGVVSENAALFFEKEGVFSLWGWRVGFVFFQAVM